MSTPIPTPRNRSRAREPDLVRIEAVDSRLPLERLVLSMTLFPNVRSGVSEEVRTLAYLGEELYLELVPQGVELGEIEMFARVRIGDADYVTGSFGFQEEDRLRIQLDWLYGGRVTIQVARNGPIVASVTHGGPTALLDSVLSPGATLQLGSRPDGTKSCLGRIYDFQIKDAL